MGDRAELRWIQPVGPDDHSYTYVLDPDHPNHSTNMAGLSPLQRRVLRAHLEIVLETVDAADAEARRKARE